MALAALAIVAPAFGGPFGPIDDHEILALVGPTGRLDWTSVPRAVAQTAVEEGRFRPFYWVVRVFEAALWGTLPWGWALDRLFLLLITLGAGTAVALRYVGAPIAVLAGLLVVAGPQGESWYRFGPQEAIATPLLLAGVALICRERQSGLVALAAAALTKEAFVPFSLAAVFLFGRVGSRRLDTAAAICIACVGAWITTFHASGLDFYRQGRSAWDVMDQAVTWARNTVRANLWPLASLAALLRGWRPPLLAGGMAVLLGLSQAYLYAGVTVGRYLLPVSLLTAGACVGALQFLSTKDRRLFAALYAVVVVVASVSLLRLSTQAIRWTEGNRRWNQGISEVRQAMSLDPSTGIVVVPRAAADFEYVIAFRDYHPRGRATVAPEVMTATTDLERLARDRLMTISSDGWSDPIAAWVRYEPWRTPVRCIAVVFRGPISSGWCETTVLVSSSAVSAETRSADSLQAGFP